MQGISLRVEVTHRLDRSMLPSLHFWRKERFPAPVRGQGGRRCILGSWDSSWFWMGNHKPREFLHGDFEGLLPCPSTPAHTPIPPGQGFLLSRLPPSAWAQPCDETGHKAHGSLLEKNHSELLAIYHLTWASV